MKLSSIIPVITMMSDGTVDPWQAIAQPTGWSWTDVIITPQRNGETVRAWDNTRNKEFDPADYAPTGKTYYVATNGSDSNDGLTAGAPLRKVSTALGKADAVVISIASGQYGYFNGWGATNHQRSVSIVATGGRVVIGAYADAGYTWSLDATYTHTYKTSRTNIAQCYDLRVGADGDYVKLTTRSTAEEVENNPGSWATVAGVVYVRLSDDAVVSDTNTRMFFALPSGTVSANITAYCYNIDFEGTFQVQATAGNNITAYMNGCTFKYATFATVAGYGGKGGYHYMVNCTGAKNYLDGLNYHAQSGFVPYVVEVGCIGRDNGEINNLDNGTTIHDGGKILRINCEAMRNKGRNIHDVSNDTESWNIACNAHDSGSVAIDVNYGCGILGTDTTKMWLDGCTSSGSATDLEIVGGTLYTRDLTSGGVFIGTPTPY